MNCTRKRDPGLAGQECPECGHANDVHQSPISTKKVPFGVELPATTCLPCAMEELVAQAAWIVEAETVAEAACRRRHCTCDVAHERGCEAAD